MQHQFAGSYILKLNYVGRLGRRLLAQADANQFIDFPDQASGQLMSQAMANVTTELRNGPIRPICPRSPGGKTSLPAGIGVANGYPNNTSFVADNLSSLVVQRRFRRYHLGSWPAC